MGVTGDLRGSGGDCTWRGGGVEGEGNRGDWMGSVGGGDGGGPPCKEMQARTGAHA